MPELSRHILVRMISREDFVRVELTRGENGFSYAFTPAETGVTSSVMADDTGDGS